MPPFTDAELSTSAPSNAPPRRPRHSPALSGERRVAELRRSLRQLA
jgi:hypothetical protein